MTQKELLYMEDAINHEKSIISILNESIKNLDNEDFISYMEDEIENHETIKNNLMNLLEESNG